MISIPSSKDKEISSFYSFLLGNPDPAVQYPISSYEIGDHGILIEHYNFDYPGQREWFSTSSFGAYTSASEIVNKHISNHKFLLGTDLFGRDVLSRLLLGTRISLSIGLISVFISLIIGIIIGGLGGFYGGNCDTTQVRVELIFTKEEFELIDRVVVEFVERVDEVERGF